MSHVKLAISPARRPALAGDMASKPSGLHLEMVICQFESSQPSHADHLFWRIGRLYGKVPTFRALARSDTVSGAY